MSVIPLTIFFSLLLAGLFIALFVHEQRRRRFASAERDSLLPLADETPRQVGGARAPRGLNLRGAQVPPQAAHDDHGDHGHDHDHDGAGCGCHDGSRPPCAGCLKRTGASTHSPRP